MEISKKIKSRNIKNIPEFKIEVCSVCQNDCIHCAHGGLRKNTKNYHLSLENVMHFIQATEMSGYLIERLSIHGSGEPLLWKHLNEGIRFFKASANIKEIEITTNGLALTNLKDVTWDCIDRIMISVYNKKQENLIKSNFEKNLYKIKVLPQKRFVSLLKDKSDAAPIPCKCICDGPMLIGNKIFLYCGPPVFDAAEIINKNIWELKHLYTDVKKDYLTFLDPHLKGNMELCRYCFSNANYLAKGIKVKHSSTGGGWR